MRPSNQPRLAPNGGSSLKPAWFILLVPAVPAVVLCPPLLIIPILVLGIWLANKGFNHSNKRRFDQEHQRNMVEYHQRRAAREWCENWTNPGWRK
jgi:hypothetical protein